MSRDHSRLCTHSVGVRDKAGLPGVRIRVCRHGWASPGVMNGAGLTTVGRLPGHRQREAAAIVIATRQDIWPPAEATDIARLVGIKPSHHRTRSRRRVAHRIAGPVGPGAARARNLRPNSSQLGDAPNRESANSTRGISRRISPSACSGLQKPPPGRIRGPGPGRRNSARTSTAPCRRSRPGTPRDGASSARKRPARRSTGSCPAIGSTVAWPHGTRRWVQRISTRNGAGRMEQEP